MRFPEWLYRLLPGDQGSQQLGIIWREATASDTNVTVGTGIYTVPTDKALVLTNVAAQYLFGAAQTIQRKRIMADPPSGTVRYNLVDEQSSAGGLSTTTANWTGEVVIPGGWRVRVEGTFSAGAAANTVNGEIHGYLIPRGTFVFG